MKHCKTDCLPNISKLGPIPSEISKIGPIPSKYFQNWADSEQKVQIASFIVANAGKHWQVSYY